MRSIAGVNLRTCSGEHMYRYATMLHRKMLVSVAHCDAMLHIRIFQKFSEKFSEIPEMTPGRPAGRGGFFTPPPWFPGGPIGAKRGGLYSGLSRNPRTCPKWLPPRERDLTALCHLPTQRQSYFRSGPGV